MAPVGVLPWVMGFAGMFYGVVSTLLGLAFVYYAWRCGLRIRSRRCWLRRAKLFRFSLLYLAGIFAVLLFEALTFKLLAAFGVF
ncbi:protoheme IX farnesyltransferase [Brucella melitensis]|nr:protoheme IX farnesyltransferase [Brucella melitensis]